MNLLESALFWIGVAIQILLLLLLLRGPFRRYYLIFLYGLAELLSGVANESVERSFGRKSVEFHHVYYSGELLVDLLLFLIVITLTYQVMEGSPSRAKVGLVLAGIAAGVMILPFVLYKDPLSNDWFNAAVQLLNFGAAIMNLGLWTALIARKSRDPQLLAVTAGLGVAVAAAAIGWGARKFTTPGGTPRELAGVFIVLVYIVKVSIWSWAFRPKAKAPPAAAIPKYS